MVKIFCAIVGMAGSAFSVKINEDDSVDDLKNAIQYRSQGVIKVPRLLMQLYMTKKDGAWLKNDGALDAVLLSGDVTSYENMGVSWELNTPEHFGRGTSLGDGVIHVLVVIPKQSTSAPANDGIFHPCKDVEIDEGQEAYAVLLRKGTYLL